MTDTGMTAPENAGDAGDAVASFDPLRRKLIRVAYRMLGSVADAEDIVQQEGCPFERRKALQRQHQR